MQSLERINSSRRRAWNCVKRRRLLVVAGSFVAVCCQLVLFVSVSRITRLPDDENIISGEPPLQEIFPLFDHKHHGNNDTDRMTITSHVHCVGDNFMSNAWLYRSCQYRNLCWHHGTSHQQWVLFPSTLQERINKEWSDRFDDSQQRNNLTFSVARMSTTFQEARLQQSTIGMRPWWRRIQPPKFLWHPTVLRSPMTEGWSTMTKVDFLPIDSVLIPISVSEPDKGGSILSLLMDTLYPIHQLLEMFGFGDRKVFLHILNRHNETFEEDCNAPCRVRLKLGVRWMGYELWEPPPIREKTTQFTCAPEAASGMGILTASGLSMRGGRLKDYQQSFHRNAGRGNDFFKFRQHILSNLDRTTKNNKIGETTSVILALEHEHQDMAAFLSKKIENFNIHKSKPHQAPFSVETLHDGLNDESLLQKATTAQFWIADSNVDHLTWPALFLPKDASLILLYDETRTVHTRRKSEKNSGPIRQDFGVWNHLSYLKTHWLAFQHNASSLVDIIVNIIDTDNAEANNERPDYEDSPMTFSGIALHEQSLLRSLQSSVHCIGENWQWDAHNYRSCKYRNICFDISTRQFVAPQYHPGSPIILRRFDILATNAYNKAVMRGDNIRLGNGQAWAPNFTVLHEKNVYMLPKDIVMIPIKADFVNMKNPGHVLWDFWLPVFNLIQLFGHERDRLLLGFDLQDEPCPETMVGGSQLCLGKLVLKYLPLLGAFTFQADTAHISSPTNDIDTLTSSLVCAETGLAGVGMLTDHGFKTHGQQHDDYKVVWNAGRGPFFWEFRRFILDNVRISPSSQRPSRVTFSINSSNNPSRRRAFTKQVDMASNLFPNSVVETIEFGKSTMEEQLQSILDTKVLISVVGGSVSTATFLQRNTCLILFYNDMDDFVSGAPGMPTMMDFDFWNNASYLRVHWLPLSTMDSEKDLTLLMYLIQEQLDFS